MLRIAPLLFAAAVCFAGGELPAQIVPPREAPRRVDVVVYGGTSSGIVAAVQVRRMGKTVVLIEPSGHLGGLTTGGLGYTDTGRRQAIGGMAREFYHRIWKWYQRKEAWRWERREEFQGRGHRPGEQAAWTFEPHVASAVFEQMLREACVPVLLRQRLDRKNGVVMRGKQIESIKMESGLVFHARMFIDATYEGDLMAAAGVSYTVGREPNSQYGETYNGVQKLQNVKNHRFLVPVSPYRVPDDPRSGLLPGVHGDPPGEEGQGDRRVQAYCFRMCMTDVPQNRRPWPKPADYDPLEYELLLRNFEAGDHRLPLSVLLVPNRKTDTNNNGAFSTDYIGANYEYPEADYATREKIVRRHLRYQMGLMWTLANHPRVPKKVRDYCQRWGLCRDEFRQHGGWSPQLYIRESRRMVSDYVMTEHNCFGTRRVEDSVGLASYGMDSHNVQRYITPQGTVQNEGDVQIHGFAPYGISYRSIVPRRGECTNLLVPVCVSASHIAYGSIRMEPVFMILGQSAATAAVLAARKQLAVQDLPYEELRRRLEKDGQLLRWEGPPGHKPLLPSQLPGIVLDDARAQYQGAWSYSGSVAPYLGGGYRHDGNQGKGNKSARFVLVVPEDGYYELRLGYSAHSNRASRVPVEIRTDGLKRRVHVNQRKKAQHHGVFEPLLRLPLKKGQTVAIVVLTQGTDGYVVVDGLQVVKLPQP